MKLVYPEFLWALLALSIPIIIHLFHFRRHKVLFFSSLQFLQKVEQDNRSTKRLKQLLVLIARLLALTFLILAFAQPYLPVSENSNEGGKPVLAIYIDNSYSMTAKGSEGELTSMAREIARKVILDAQIDTRILLTTNALSGAEQRFLTKPEAIKELDKIAPNPIIRKIDDVINWQRNFIDRQNQTAERLGTRQFILLSDFQKHTSRFSTIKKDNSSYYYPIKLSAQSTSNVYIDSVWFDSPVHKVNQPVQLNVRVTNAGNEDLNAIELHAEIAGQKRDVFLDLPAGAVQTTTLNYTDKRAGIKQGKITVNDKQLFWDDDYYLSYEVASNSKVLSINGPSVSQGVAQVFSVEPFYQFTSLSQDQLTLDAIENQDLIILNGINSMNSALSNALIEFSSNGGTVSLFPGTSVVINEWNRLLSGLNLPTIANSIKGGLRIKNLNEDDEFFEPVFEQKNQQVNFPEISTYYRLNTSSSAFTLITLKNDAPLFVKSKTNAYLFASSLDPSFSALTSNALFPTLILRMGELSQRRLPISMTIGSAAYFPVYANTSGEQPIRLKNRATEFIPQVRKEQRVTYISISGMEAIEQLKAGNYFIEKDNERIAGIALNYNRNESTTATLDNETIRSQLKENCSNVVFNEIESTISEAKLKLERPFEYWKMMVVFALLFVLAEMALLKLWK